MRLSLTRNKVKREFCSGRFLRRSGWPVSRVIGRRDKEERGKGALRPAEGYVRSAARTAPSKGDTGRIGKKKERKKKLTWDTGEIGSEE